ncbi:MAG: DUF309 domain-containing protein [Cyanobacteria bacterium SID2]|nr:DUF309 domain-containing protein [Cyanobacteria bacterium SID2]MBP0006045.1 DUF309 domain-containing protein [Cyanobacteria bacterium SBC]
MNFPEQFWQGVRQFNEGQFYACHDTLEAIWLESIDPNKTFFQGILQIAVGYYHLSNHNWRGSVVLLGEGTNRLRRYRPSYGDIDVDAIFLSALETLQTLQEAGEERVAEFAEKYGLNGRDPVLPVPRIRSIDRQE